MVRARSLSYARTASLSEDRASSEWFTERERTLKEHGGKPSVPREHDRLGLESPGQLRVAMRVSVCSWLGFRTMWAG
jgi:hypothetical protein